MVLYVTLLNYGSNDNDRKTYIINVTSFKELYAKEEKLYLMKEYRDNLD